MACIEGYLQRETRKFSKEAELIPGFTADLLGAARVMVTTMSCQGNPIEFKEPIIGESVY